MATPGKAFPAKIKDAIVEAILEVRFETTTVQEILIGRLADYEPWRAFQQRRLPMYEIPAAFRQVDPDLRYTAIFELREGDVRSVRVGPQALSYHQYAPYVGWAALQPKLNDMIDALFEKAENVKIHRLGLRYLNALRSDVHSIASITDLDLKIAVAEQQVNRNAMLAFSTEPSEPNRCTVRVLTPDFVTGAVPPSTTVLIDVDVYSKAAPGEMTKESVKGWVETAHTQEKDHFRRLLTDATIDALTEH